MEMALRIFSNFQQNDWSDWLPIVQYQLNSCTSSTTKQIPYETWMGFLPKAHQPWQDSNLPAVEARQHAIRTAWNKAITSISHAQLLWQRLPQFHPYQKGDRVWLEGTHLHTSHPTHKPRPKRFGPFEVTEELSPVTYRLNLPPTWKLHNAFHASLLHLYHEMQEHGGNQVLQPLS